MGIVGITGFALALSWAGFEYSWSSAAVLVPLFGGLAFFAVWLWYELRLEHPSLPFAVFVRLCLFRLFG